MIKIKNCHIYWDGNSFYGWAIWKKTIYDSQFIKSFNEKSDERYFLELGVQYPEKRHDLDNNLPVLTERIITEKFWKLIHITNLKQALNHGFLLKKSAQSH